MLLPFCLYPSILYTSFLYFPLKHTQSFFTFLHNSIIHQSLFASLHPYLSLFTLSFFNFPHYILIHNPSPHSSFYHLTLRFRFNSSPFFLHFCFLLFLFISNQLFHSSFFRFRFTLFALHSSPFLLTSLI